MESEFKRVLVAGLGLMGGSFAKALRRACPEIQMDGMDLNEGALASAVETGVIDAGFGPGQANAYDLLVLATPLAAYESVLVQLLPYLQAGCLVTDLGSVKGRVHKEMEALLPDTVSFLGGHPMCGSEKSGFAAAMPDLFEGKAFFLTGDAQGGEILEDGKVKAYSKMLQAIGAKIVRTNPYEHDTMVAKSSHMPKLTAVLLSLLLEGERGADPYIGSGFRDSTRVAGGDPKVWRDIFLYNAEEMIENVNTLQDQLDRVKGYLKADDGDELLRLFHRAKGFQDQIKE